MSILTQPKSREFICGIVEGFYGRPWTIEQRKELFKRMNKLCLNAYMYAPKDDTKHRTYWRELYSKAEGDCLTKLIKHAKDSDIDFYYALSPGLNITFSKAKDIDAIKKKMDQVASFGCSAFALLFDDIDAELSTSDKLKFNSFAHAQATITNEIYEHLGKPKFMFCPTEYCVCRAVPNVKTSEYLITLGKILDPDIAIMWTGPRVVSKRVTKAGLDELKSVLTRGNRLVLWDNIHANDYDPKRIYLGPFSGRDSDIICSFSDSNNKTKTNDPQLNEGTSENMEFTDDNVKGGGGSLSLNLCESLKNYGGPLDGVLSNPNCEFEANFVAIHTLAQWALSHRVTQIAQQLPLTHHTDASSSEIININDHFEICRPYIPKRALEISLKRWLEYVNNRTPYTVQIPRCLTTSTSSSYETAGILDYYQLTSSTYHATADTKTKDNALSTFSTDSSESLQTGSSSKNGSSLSLLSEHLDNKIIINEIIESDINEEEEGDVIFHSDDSSGSGRQRKTMTSVQQSNSNYTNVEFKRESSNTNHYNEKSQSHKHLNYESFMERFRKCERSYYIIPSLHMQPVNSLVDKLKDESVSIVITAPLPPPAPPFNQTITPTTNNPTTNPPSLNPIFTTPQTGIRTPPNTPTTFSHETGPFLQSDLNSNLQDCVQMTNIAVPESNGDTDKVERMEVASNAPNTFNESESASNTFTPPTTSGTPPPPPSTAVMSPLINHHQHLTTSTRSSINVEPLTINNTNNITDFGMSGNNEIMVSNAFSCQANIIGGPTLTPSSAGITILANQTPTEGLECDMEFEREIKGTFDYYKAQTISDAVEQIAETALNNLNQAANNYSNANNYHQHHRSNNYQIEESQDKFDVEGDPINLPNGALTPEETCLLTPPSSSAVVIVSHQPHITAPNEAVFKIHYETFEPMQIEPPPLLPQKSAVSLSGRPPPNLYDPNSLDVTDINPTHSNTIQENDFHSLVETTNIDLQSNQNQDIHGINMKNISRNQSPIDQIMASVSDDEKQNLNDTDRHMVNRVDNINHKISTKSSHLPKKTSDPYQYKEINIEDALLLAELFYLPFEHGKAGQSLLEEFHWLKSHAITCLCPETYSNDPSKLGTADATANSKEDNNEKGSTSGSGQQSKLNSVTNNLLQPKLRKWTSYFKSKKKESNSTNLTNSILSQPINTIVESTNSDEQLKSADMLDVKGGDREQTPEEAEWRGRAHKYVNGDCERVIRLCTKMTMVRNRAVLYEYFPYVWDLKGVVTLARGFISWLALSRFPSQPLTSAIINGSNFFCNTSSTYNNNTNTGSNTGNTGTSNFNNLSGEDVRDEIILQTLLDDSKSKSNERLIEFRKQLSELLEEKYSWNAYYGKGFSIVAKSTYSTINNFAQGTTNNSIIPTTTTTTTTSYSTTNNKSKDLPVLNDQFDNKNKTTLTSADTGKPGFELDSNDKPNNSDSINDLHSSGNQSKETTIIFNKESQPGGPRDTSTTVSNSKFKTQDSTALSDLKAAYTNHEDEEDSTNDDKIEFIDKDTPMAPPIDRTLKVKSVITFDNFNANTIVAAMDNNNNKISNTNNSLDTSNTIEMHIVVNDDHTTNPELNVKKDRDEHDVKASNSSEYLAATNANVSSIFDPNFDPLQQQQSIGKVNYSSQNDGNHDKSIVAPKEETVTIFKKPIKNSSSNSTSTATTTTTTPSEPTILRGGLQAEFHRMLPLDTCIDLFCHRPPYPPLKSTYEIRPYKPSDEQAINDITRLTFDDGRDGSHWFTDCPDLPADYLATPYLTLCPTTCFVLINRNYHTLHRSVPNNLNISNNLNHSNPGGPPSTSSHFIPLGSQLQTTADNQLCDGDDDIYEERICGYILCAPDTKKFYDAYELSVLPELREKYKDMNGKDKGNSTTLVDKFTSDFNNETSDHSTSNVAPEVVDMGTGIETMTPKCNNNIEMDQDVEPQVTSSQQPPLQPPSLYSSCDILSPKCKHLPRSTCDDISSTIQEIPTYAQDLISSKILNYERYLPPKLLQHYPSTLHFALLPTVDDFSMPKRMLACLMSVIKLYGSTGLFVKVPLKNINEQDFYIKLLGFYELTMLEEYPPEALILGRAFY